MTSNKNDFDIKIFQVKLTLIEGKIAYHTEKH